MARNFSKYFQIVLLSFLFGVMVKLVVSLALMAIVYFHYIYFLGGEPGFSLAALKRSTNPPDFWLYFVLAIIISPILENLIFLLFKVNKIDRMVTLVGTILVIGVVAFILHGSGASGSVAAAAFVMFAFQYRWVSRKLSAVDAYWSTVISHAAANLTTYSMIWLRFNL